MKPTKNKVFCKDCGRTKMLFETEKKANNFIVFNQEEIEMESGFAPQRSYFCLFCGGWHTTSRKEKIGMSRNEKLLENYLKEEAEKIVIKKGKVNNKGKQNEIMSELENQIKTMDRNQMEIFFLEKINLLKKEIEDIIDITNPVEKGKLKELRQTLDIVNIVKKRNGFHNTKDFSEKIKEKAFEDWKLWIEQKGYACE